MSPCQDGCTLEDVKFGESSWFNFQSENKKEWLWLEKLD